jgi:hypothetical protein
MMRFSSVPSSSYFSLIPIACHQDQALCMTNGTNAAPFDSQLRQKTQACFASV